MLESKYGWWAALSTGGVIKHVSTSVELHACLLPGTLPWLGARRAVVTVTVAAAGKPQAALYACELKPKIITSSVCLLWLSLCWRGRYPLNDSSNLPSVKLYRSGLF